MISYTWDIWKIECVPTVGELTNVVKHVYWYRRASNDVYQATIDGWSTISDPDKDAFVSYNSLTKQDVINWLESVVDVTKLDNDLAEMLVSVTESKSVIVIDIPWINK
jgi:hypothetical protein